MEEQDKIRSVYGEVAGLYDSILSNTTGFLMRQVGDQYNNAVGTLGDVSGRDFSKFRLVNADLMSAAAYHMNVARPKIASLVRSLQEEYGFGSHETSTITPLVLTVQQNQTVNVNIIPIQQLIETIDDSELKEQLNELRTAVENEKNPTRVSLVLTKIMAKSWEVFIKVLPYILEHLGNNSSSH